MKLAITDIEATGLSHRKHEIIEIGCVICDSETMKIIEEFSIKVKPEHPETGSPEAYAVNGYNEKDWEDAISKEEAIDIYIEKTKDCIFVAQCICFDYPFIEELAYKTNRKLLLNRYKFDIPSISWSKTKSKSYSLKTMCEYFGIEPEDKVHRAINGVRKEYEVLKKLLKWNT